MVSRQTGAPVVGAPLTVEIALARHSTIQPGLVDIYASLYEGEVGSPGW